MKYCCQSLFLRLFLTNLGLCIIFFLKQKLLFERLNCESEIVLREEKKMFKREIKNMTMNSERTLFLLYFLL